MTEGPPALHALSATIAHVKIRGSLLKDVRPDTSTRIRFMPCGIFSLLLRATWGQGASVTKPIFQSVVPVMRRRLKLYSTALLVMAMASCVGRPVATSAALSSYASSDSAPGMPSTWSIASNGGRAIAVAGGAVIVQSERIVDPQRIGSQHQLAVSAYDIASGKELWRRDGRLAVAGTPLFLADGQNLERVDIRTGRVLWRSRALCSEQNQNPSYVDLIGVSVYVGCQGGELFRLDAANGGVLASQQIPVDEYQSIELLPHDTLAVAGYASIGMYRRSVLLHAQTLEPVKPIQTFAPDLYILGVRNGEAIVADVCCRGTPDTNSPGSVLGVSLATGETLWSVAIHPYRPQLPLSDVEPGAGIFALAADRLYVGTRTALFMYRIGDLRSKGAKASRSEIYSDLRDRPQMYEGRYLVISEGKGATITRAALFDTVAGRETWSDASLPWSPAPPAVAAPTVAQMYGVTPNIRRFGLLSLSDGKMLPLDTGCYVQTSNETFAVALCGGRGKSTELALFDLRSTAKMQAAPPEARPAQPQTPPAATTDVIRARWTAHQWIFIGSTDATYFFGREPDGIVAVSRSSGRVAWQNTSVCTVGRLAQVLNGTLYVACPGLVAILDPATGRLLRKQKVAIYGFNAIVTAGESAIVVEGWNDGAALRNDMAILDKQTLKPVTDRQMTDSTFLGVIGHRAYIDDWCCFGRPDQYRPATIYSISLKDGSATQAVDLYPEPQLHPARMQPLGQGGHNYLQGNYFYVVTPNYTYRYDLRNLAFTPLRIPTASRP